MKRVGKYILCCLLLMGCTRRPDRAVTGVVRTAQNGKTTLTCVLSDTNLLSGSTAVFALKLEAPGELEADFKRLAFDDFLVFAEEHPAYKVTSNGALIYEHLYHLQARKPGMSSLPEIKVRVRDILSKDEPVELILPPLSVLVRGVDVQAQSGLQWSDPVEVSL